MQISGGVLTDVTAVFYPSPTPPCCARSHEFRHVHAFSDSRPLPSLGFLKSSPFPMARGGPESSRTRSCIAKASGSSGHDLVPVAPHQLESPVGQLLEQILQTHPHLLPAAIDQQLENLQNEKDAQKEERPPSSMDLSLYKRIAQVKEKDRQKILEEIMYCWIVHKFVDKEILMIPKISSTSDPSGRVDFWPNQEMKLESVHSAEALEMIQNHVALVLGDRVVGPLQSVVQISKIKLGKLYAASIMYGYFLKRVDERFQLERSMNTLPEGFKEQQSSFADPSVPQSPFWDPDSLIRIQPDYDMEDEGLMGGGGGDDKMYRLRSYVMYLDAETLQRYATIRSKEAISLIEKQTQALFGRPDIKVSEDGSLGASNDEVVNVTFSGLTMLVLEAVAFGSFLWDAENYVESRYQFLKS
ncbi:UV-B-induced protein At3g17800, chloroplastic isoform X1 [Lactuca sativa]|uniref:UV-B-induced protein At3g17800, chloroplastic isoform X1 n=2 Tax=Lactuca sativa TaxID=4236 RepID=UPI000CAF5940|nr:UV-B-induced protein At3g17800, chloroplastic isoform X1 [Lactuca sativa]